MFHFHGLINISFNKSESFGNRLRSKVASFALECTVHFPFFTDCEDVLVPVQVLGARKLEQK